MEGFGNAHGQKPYPGLERGLGGHHGGSTQFGGTKQKEVSLVAFVANGRTQATQAFQDGTTEHSGPVLIRFIPGLFEKAEIEVAKRPVHFRFSGKTTGFFTMPVQ